MNCKRILLLYAAVLILAAAFHVPDTAEAKQQERSILIVYSTLDGKKISRCENARPYRRSFYIPCDRCK